MNRSTVRCIAAALLVLASMGAQAQTTLRVHEYPGILGTLLRVAIDKGYCTKHEIRCVTQTIPSGAMAMQALLSGGIDVAAPAVEILIQAATAGADLKIIGGASNASPFYLIVGPDLFGSAGKGYPAIMHDLKGKRIGVTTRGSAPEFQMKTMLLQAGMKADDVTFVAVGAPNTSYPALVNKQIDAVYSFTPFDGMCDVLKTCRIALTLARGEGPSVLTNQNGAGVVYAVRRELAQKNPAAIEALVKALRDAEAFIASPANAAEVAAIVEKNFKLDMPRGNEVTKSSLERLKPSLVVGVNKAAIQAAAEYLRQTGQLDKPFDAARLF
jgi:NitT/TauT family transport system substrate-binding protein